MDAKFGQVVYVRTITISISAHDYKQCDESKERDTTVVDLSKVQITVR